VQIWVDADACPNVIKEILFRAANRTKTNVILVANQAIFAPPSSVIKKVQVLAGFDMADNYIVQHMESGDLVITADMLLADTIVSKEGIVLNPRGKLYNKNNIKEHLSMRNFSEELRSSGMNIGGPTKLGKKEVQTFANCLDQLLASQK
jgi:hypothetical protein